MKREITCLGCNIKVPAESRVCPFCKQPLIASSAERPQEEYAWKQPVQKDSSQAFKEFYLKYGKWLMPPVALVCLVSIAYVVFLMLTGLSIDIPKDPVFQIKARTVKADGGVIILTGTIKNHGEDLQTLSLRSVRVSARFKLKNGSVEKKHVFPKTDHGAEGALLHGETGAFEIKAPQGASSVILVAEIVDLGESRRFRLPGERTK